MKYFFFLVIAFSPVVIIAQDQRDVSKQLDAFVTKDQTSLEQLYYHLHEHPELSQQEQKTSERMALELRLLGFNVFDKIGGFGVAGVLKNGEGPTLLIRTDMDALPVEEKTGLAYTSKVKALNATGAEVSVMHACGHDLHMTVFIGTARALAANRKRWKGTVVMVAQPSEENGIGARAMLNDGLYDKIPYPDFAISLHNHAGMKAGTIGYSTAAFMASVDMMDITVFGKGGHGAGPHQTIDPVVLAAEMIVAFQTIVSREINPLEPAVVTVGSIHGGTSYNIIPDQVKMQLTLRSYSDEVRRHVIASIQNKSKHLALQAGLPENKLPEVTYNDSAPATVNDKNLTLKLVNVFQGIFKPNNVMEMPPSMVGEDFSRFATYKKTIPYTMFWLGTVAPETFDKAKSDGTPLPTLHSATFKPDPSLAIPTGVKAMTAAAMEILK